MGKKKDWLDDFIDSLCILLLLQSLVIPWETLHNTPRPPSSPPLLQEGEQFGNDFQNEQEISNFGLSRKGQGYDPLSPLWRQRTVANIARTLYPEDGLIVGVLTGLLNAPNHQGPVSPHGPTASHPEGTFSPRPHRDLAAATLAPADENQELSLEEYDLIDVLWRQDIDAEKGSAPLLPSPDLQHEQDLQLLTEKHITQGLPTPATQHQLYNRLSRAYEELKGFQKGYHSSNSFDALEPKQADGKDKFLRRVDRDQRASSSSDGGSLSSAPDEDEKVETKFNLEEFFPDLDVTKTEVGEEAHSHDPNLPLQTASDATDASWEELFRSLEGTDDGQPTNDVCLSSANLRLDDSIQTPTDSVEDPRLSEFWSGLEARGDDAVSSLGMENRSRMELDSLPTPSLQLSPTDITRLFTDRQVTADVAEAASIHTGLLDEASGYTVQGPSTSSGDRRRTERRRSYDQFVPLGNEEGQSDVALEAFPPLVSNAFDYSEMIPRKEMPTTNPASPQLHSPSSGSGPSLSPTASHVDHDHMYWSSSPEGASEGGLGYGGRGEEGEGSSRMEGKLHPNLPQHYLEVKMEEEEEEGLLAQQQSPSTRAASGRKSQDETLASEYGLPVSATEIVAMSLQQFQALTKSPYLTEQQLEVVKKIRRRGKNKLAARNCRKRRVDNMEQLSTEASLLQQEHQVESVSNMRLLQEIAKEQAEIERLQKELDEM